MNNKLLAAVAVSFALSTGAAFAQQDTDPAPNTRVDSESNATADKPVYDPQMLQPFHTDDTLTMLNPAEQNRDYFLSLSPDEQQALRDQCSGDVADAVTGVDPQTTASIEAEMPTTMADLCVQVNAW